MYMLCATYLSANKYLSLFYGALCSIVAMNSRKKTRAFIGDSWRKNPLECFARAAPAQKPLVLPIKKESTDH